MWRILQAEEPDNFVLATNKTSSVREFVELSFNAAGINIVFEGVGIEEKAINVSNGKVVMKVNSEFYRPAEVDLLIGDATKAKTQLGWEPKTGIEELCNMMIASDIELNKKGLSF